MNRGWMWSWIRTELIHSLEVGQYKVIWSRKHPWVEQGKGLKCLAALLSGPARMHEHPHSAVASKQLIKSLSAACVSKAGALQKAKRLYDSQVQRPGGQS